MSFEVSTCTTSPRWLRVSLLKTAMPRSDLEREGVISITSLTTCSSSPGRMGHCHLTSTLAPMMPPAMGARPRPGAAW